jgi:hypothetical protein
VANALNLYRLTVGMSEMADCQSEKAATAAKARGYETALRRWLYSKDIRELKGLHSD